MLNRRSEYLLREIVTTVASFVQELTGTIPWNLSFNHYYIVNNESIYTVRMLFQLNIASGFRRNGVNCWLKWS